MKVAEQPAESLNDVGVFRWGRIIEKHEGTERWSDTQQSSEPYLLAADGQKVPLPIGQEHHPNPTVLHDSTCATHWIDCRHLAACAHFPELTLSLKTVNHERFWRDSRGPVPFRSE